jgi:hypothetical protein
MSEADQDQEVGLTGFRASSDPSLGCFGALLLALEEVAGCECGVLGSHVTKLHGTPWREQFVHGFSSSHCVTSARKFDGFWTVIRQVDVDLPGRDVPLHDGLYTVCSLVLTCSQC